MLKAENLSKGAALSIIVLLFLSTRLLALFVYSDNIFTCEELHQGLVAKEIMEGPDLPLLEYPPTAYNGGTLIVGIVTVPFFLLFGPNIFALKLTPLLFSTVTLIILFLFAWKFFNRRVAVIAALLYIFSSRNWLIFNLYNAGFHSENLVFTVLALYLFYEIVFGKKNHPVYYLGLGLTCGFGTYFAPTFLITQAAIFLAWFLHDSNLLKKRGLYIFLLGFLIGMIPWFYFNFDTQFAGFKEISSGFLGEGGSFIAGGISGIWERFLNVIFFSPMLGFIEEEGLFSNLSGKLYYLIYLFSFIYILRDKKYSLSRFSVSREFFILIFPGLLIAMSSLYVVGSGGSYNFLDWKYVVGLYISVFLAVAIILDKIFAKFRAVKILSLVIFSVFLILSLIKYIPKVDNEDSGKAFGQLGYSYFFMSCGLHSKYPHNLYKILNDITKLSEPERYEVLTRTFTILVSEPLYPVPFKEYVELSLKWPEEYRQTFYRTLIKGLYYTSPLSLKDIVSEVNRFSQEVMDKDRPYLYEGIGAVMVKRYPGDSAKYKEGADCIDEKYLNYYYRGLADPDFIEPTLDYINRCKSCLSWLDEAYKPLYLEGIGEILAKMGTSHIMERETDGEDYFLVYAFFQEVSPEYKIRLLEGAGKSLALFYSQDNDSEVHKFINNFKGKDKEIIFKTMVNNLGKRYVRGDKKSN